VRVPSVAAAALCYADLFGVTPRVRADGVTFVPLAGLEVVLEEGTPTAARGVVVHGVGRLSQALEDLGVRAAIKAAHD
jgi:hypothetical protein